MHLHQASALAGVDVEKDNLHLRAAAAVEDRFDPVDPVGTTAGCEMSFETGNRIGRLSNITDLVRLRVLEDVDVK